MHEFGLTSRIVGAVLKAAEQNQEVRVIRVDLLIGQLTFLEITQVEMAYQFLTRGTILEGSALIIQEVSGLIKCTECDHQWEVCINIQVDLNSFSGPIVRLACSRCGGKGVIIRGKECQINGIVYQID